MRALDHVSHQELRLGPYLTLLLRAAKDFLFFFPFLGRTFLSICFYVWGVEGV